MGGRFALHAALAAPDRVDRLVLIGATAGISDPDERAARVAADEARASEVEAEGVDAFVASWLAAPLFATLPPDAHGAAHRCRNTAAGLASSLRTAGTGAQEPLWDRLGELTMPVLCLAGSLDTKFATLGRRLAATLPSGEFAEVPDAGHAAHTERPAAVARLIADWLATL